MATYRCNAKCLLVFHLVASFILYMILIHYANGSCSLLHYANRMEIRLRRLRGWRYCWFWTCAHTHTKRVAHTNIGPQSIRNVNWIASKKKSTTSKPINLMSHCSVGVSAVAKLTEDNERPDRIVCTVFSSFAQKRDG